MIFEEEDDPVKVVKFIGLDIAIEYPAGSVKHGENDRGEKWTRKYTTDYGFIKDAIGVDGDNLDCYLALEPDEQCEVYVIHQMTPDGEEFDEDKCMLGYSSEEEALNDFEEHCHAPDKMIGGCSTMSQSAFKAMLKKCDGEKIMGNKEEIKSLGDSVPDGVTEIRVVSPTGKTVKIFDDWSKLDEWKSFVGETVASLYEIKNVINGREIINEGLATGDLQDLLVPRVSIDEYVAKDGGDNVVIAFFIMNVPEAVEPLRRFCDRCPGVIETDSGDADTMKNTSIVYAEMDREKIDASKVSRMIELVFDIAKVKPKDISVCFPNTEEMFPYSRDTILAYFSKLIAAREKAKRQEEKAAG